MSEKWRIIMATKQEIFEDAIINKTILNELKWDIVTFEREREKQITGPVYKLDVGCKCVLVYRYLCFDDDNNVETDIQVEMARMAALCHGCKLDFTRKEDLIKSIEEQIYDIDGIMTEIIGG